MTTQLPSHTHHEKEIQQLMIKNKIIDEGLQIALNLIQMDFDHKVKKDIKTLSRQMKRSFLNNQKQINEYKKHILYNDGFRLYCTQCGFVVESF